VARPVNRLQQIKNRLAAATPAPWRVQCEGDSECWSLIGARKGVEYALGTIGGYFEEGRDPASGLPVPVDNGPDAELIANAPGDLEWAVGEIERLRSLVQSVFEQAEVG
jgi:hypothetical protein